MINSSLSSSSSISFSINWHLLIIWIISLLALLMISAIVLCLIRLDRCQNLSSKTKNYSICSSPKLFRDNIPQTTSINHEKNHSKKPFNYDDMMSMGSYIYPITSSTSLLQRSSSSSQMKSEQYAIIDGNSSIHWPIKNVR